MATFEVQVEGLTGLSIDGSSAPTQTELTQFLTDGAKEIINSLPKSLLEKCASVDTLDNSTTTLTSINRKGIILNVLRDEGNGANDIEHPCRYVASHLRGKIQDSSEMDFATSTDPAYLIYNNALEIYPTPTATQQAYVYYVSYPEVNYNDSDISSLVLTGVIATNSDPSVFTKSNHGLSTGDEVRFSGFNEMTELNGMVGTVTEINVNTFSIDGISGDPAETTGGQVSRLGGFPIEAEYLVTLYASIKALQNKMSSKFAELPTDVTFISLPVAPVAPVLISNQIGTLPTAPVYTGLSIAPSFSTVDTFISTDEDVELASVKIQEINSQINEYQASMQNQMNLFNDANIEYQAEVNKLIENARLSSQDDAQSLQKYSNELSSYSTKVQIYQADANTKIQNYNVKIQKHITDYQWLSSQYKQLKDDYTAGLQKLIS